MSNHPDDNKVVKNLTAVCRDGSDYCEDPKDYPKEISNFINSVRSELIGAEKKNKLISTLHKKNGKLWKSLTNYRRMEK